MTLRTSRKNADLKNSRKRLVKQSCHFCTSSILQVGDFHRWLAVSLWRLLKDGGQENTVVLYGYISCKTGIYGQSLLTRT